MGPLLSLSTQCKRSFFKYKLIGSTSISRSVTDLVLLALRLLREDIQEVVDFIEPVELLRR